MKIGCDLQSRSNGIDRISLNCDTGVDTYIEKKKIHSREITRSLIYATLLFVCPFYFHFPACSETRISIRLFVIHAVLGIVARRGKVRRLAEITKLNSIVYLKETKEKNEQIQRHNKEITVPIPLIYIFV